MSHDTILLFGATRVSLEAARRFELLGHPFLLVDSSDEALERGREHGYGVQRCDYTDDAELQTLGIGQQVRTVFCLFLEEAKNVFLTISARSLDPTLNIISVSESTNSARRLLAAGANRVIDPYEVSAHKIYGLIRRPKVVDVLEKTIYGHYDLNVIEVPVRAHSDLAGHMLEEIRARLTENLIILGLVDRVRGDQLIFLTQGLRHRLDPGDVLVMIGAHNEVTRFKERFRA